MRYKSVLVGLFYTIVISGLSILPSIAYANEGAITTAGERVFSFAGCDINNTILTGALISLLIILLSKFLLRDGVSMVPSHGQAIIESIITTLRSLIEPIVGQKVFKHIFPILLGYFVFILLHNWSGLLPGVGSIAWISDGEAKFFIRPTNSDLNTTLALALLSLFIWAYFIIKYVGIHALYHEVFGNKANKRDMSKLMYSLLFFIFFAVGFIECLSILFRVVSLSFRLYGNVFGGENLLHHMSGFVETIHQCSIVRYLTYLIPLPFYFLELIIGIIQASVFTLLVSVYVGLVSNQEEEEISKNI